MSRAQRRMYEAQILRGGAPCELAAAVKRRDCFVVGEVLSRFPGPCASSITIAELSVGDGQLARELVTRIRHASITCVDISPTRLSMTRDLVDGLGADDRSRVTFVECNLDERFEELPSEAYDVVIALDILEHVLDVFGFVDHCRRILKPAGVLILRVPNIAYVRHRLALLVGALPVTASWFGPRGQLRAWKESWGWDGGHLHLFTLPVLFRLLNESSFAILTCRDAGARLEWIRNVYPRLLYANPTVIAVKQGC